MNTPKRFWCWLPLWLTSCLVAFYLVVSPSSGSAFTGLSLAAEDIREAECWECALAEELAEETDGVRKARKPTEAAAKKGPQPLLATPIPWQAAITTVALASPATLAGYITQVFVPSVQLRQALLRVWQK
jgi:hypothetical protein